MIEIVVLGLPATQGNKTGRPFRRKDGSLGVVLTEGKTAKSAEHLHSWRGMIAQAASEVLKKTGARTIDGAVVVGAKFFLPRPKSAKHALFPISRPDLDKLQRAVGDALRGVAYSDDSRIVDWNPRKRFTDQWNHGIPGVFITVRAATVDDL